MGRRPVIVIGAAGRVTGNFDTGDRDAAADDGCSDEQSRDPGATECRNARCGYTRDAISHGKS
jgi:hypothetical protein